MSDRDELAALIESQLMDASRTFYAYKSGSMVVGLDVGYDGTPIMIDCRELADAILAAGTWLPHIPESQVVYPRLADECEHDGWFTVVANGTTTYKRQCSDCGEQVTITRT